MPETLTLLLRKDGILPNLKESLSKYAESSGKEREQWESEFNHWYGLMYACNRDVADEHRARFYKIKRGE